MTFTVKQMWVEAEGVSRASIMLAECLNRLEATQDALDGVFLNQAFVGTLAHDVVAHAKWILDGEPDGADD